MRFTLILGLFAVSRPWNAGAWADPDLSFDAPEGFAVERAAGEAQVRFPMFGAFDDRGRLFVTESSGGDLYLELQRLTRDCRISLLEDRDGDGRFETAGVFADHLAFPMGLAWRDGKLYVAQPPEIITLEDTDGDGRADRREVVIGQFGHETNGSLHGLIFGPGGRLYMTIGRPDGYRFELGDGSILEGHTGALLRCRSDGSRPEVIGRGFENLVEVTFLPTGEIIGTVNWFSMPKSGMRDALVHLVEGGLYPLHPDTHTPLPITGDPLPAITIAPAVAFSGLVRYRGTAFPEPMRGSVFTAQHNARKIGRHQLIREGSSFVAIDEDFVTVDDPDFHPSDVIEDADGSLLVIDTGSWYIHHCPTGRIRNAPATGGIYRVRYGGADPAQDPRGANIHWDAASAEKLVNLLGDPRPAVRDRANRRLARRSGASIRELDRAVQNADDPRIRRNAIWTLAEIDDADALEPLRRALANPDPDIIATAIRALALREDAEVEPDLIRLMQSEDSSVRMAAAEALAHGAGAASLPAIWEALAGEPDRFLEHALIHAVYRIARRSDLVDALDHPHPRVQKAALILLDQPPWSSEKLDSGAVVNRLKNADAELRRTALQILRRHPEWADHAMELLRSWIETPAGSEDQRQGIHELILAFQDNAAVQNLVGQNLVNAALSDETRRGLLRTVAAAHPRELPPSWTGAFERLLKNDDPAIRLRTVKAISALGVDSLDDPLNEIANDPDEPAALRLEALRSLVSRRPVIEARGFVLLVDQLKSRNEPVARLAAAEVLRRAELTDVQLLQALEASRGDPLIPPRVLLPALRATTTPEAVDALLAHLEKRAREGWSLDPVETAPWLEPAAKLRPLRVESLLKATQTGDEDQRAKFDKYAPLLKGGDAALGRGVYASGPAACSTCHAIADLGGHVGPDLTKIGAIRSGRDILESILFPSLTFAQRYEPYLIETQSGEMLSGIIARRDAEAILLRESSGREVALRNDQIREIRRQTVSVMPEGLEQILGREELQDLLAYLQSLR